LFNHARTTLYPVVVAIVIGALVLAAAPRADARTELERYQRQHRLLGRSLDRVRTNYRADAALWTSVVKRSTRLLQRGPGRGAVVSPRRWRFVKQHRERDRWVATMRLRRLERRTAGRVTSLVARREAATTWLETWGVFEVCPIDGENDVADNFGIMVRLPGVPVHRHMGNDISALTGTPIVAPFDGYATASTGVLGGMEVRVHGDDGYVYNAHLSRYGKLGDVRTGDVIGYVGSTGDATAPHDHFEWHPDDGVAVDPNPYLSVSCE
jgi:murein DD-endopeptidase MepM/ murein hydrolase activator NlpD